MFKKVGNLKEAVKFLEWLTEKDFSAEENSDVMDKVLDMNNRNTLLKSVNMLIETMSKEFDAADKVSKEYLSVSVER